MNDQEKLINYLSSCISDNKKERMQAVLNERTLHITIALENIYQSHNASAIVRSADCFGIQSVHMIEDTYVFRPTQGIAMGAAGWLDVHRYKATKDCYRRLKADGYKIVATTISPGAIPLAELPLNKKTAFVFGTEDTGLTDYAIQNADAHVTIPMHGFTQSLNVSVCAALILFHVTNSLRASTIAWQLTELERQEIALRWLKKNIRGAHMIEKKFLETLI